MKNRVKILVDGKAFTLVGEESEEHIKNVAAYIDEKMQEVRSEAVAVKMDSSLAYVLTAINVADDYFKEKEKNSELEGRNLGLSTRLEEIMPQLEAARAELAALKNHLEANTTDVEFEPLEDMTEVSEDMSAEDEESSEQKNDSQDTTLRQTYNRHKKNRKNR